MANIDALLKIPLCDLNDYLLEHQPAIEIIQKEWSLYPCRHRLSREHKDLVPTEELLELILDGRDGGIEEDYSVPLNRYYSIHLFHVTLEPAAVGAHVEVLSLYFWADYVTGQDVHRKAFEVTRRINEKEAVNGIGFGLSAKSNNVSQGDIDQIAEDINRLRAKTRMVEIVENSGHNSEIGSF